MPSEGWENYKGFISQREISCPIFDMKIEEHVIFSEAENPNPAGISASGFSDRLQGV